MKVASSAKWGAHKTDAVHGLSFASGDALHRLLRSYIPYYNSVRLHQGSGTVPLLTRMRDERRNLVPTKPMEDPMMHFRLSRVALSRACPTEKIEASLTLTCLS